MWPLHKALIIPTLFVALMAAYEANAQVPVDPTAQQPAIPPAPSDAALQQQNQPFTAQAVAPAPTIEPMLSPQDQAARDARLAAAAQQQAQAQQTQTQQNQIQPQNPPASNSAAPVTDNAPIAQTPGAPVAPAGQVFPATQNDHGAQQTAAPAIDTSAAIIPPPQQNVETGIVPISPPPAAAPADPVTPITPSQVQGFSPAAQTTNPGMDMNLNPQMVSAGASIVTPPDANVPYEVQLQQRTMELQQQARGLAFDQAKLSLLPMEPHEIRDVLGRLKDTQEAVQTPVRPAPKVGNVIQTVSTDPSAKPPTIHLAAGNVSTLNIIDITGEPWPIVDIGVGGFFDVKPPEPGGHVIRITPQKDFARGNIVIRLLKMTTPITFQLQAGGTKVDYRFDARIPEYGPNAKMPLIDEGGIGSIAGDKVTTSFLEGVPPTGAEKIKIDGLDGRTSAYRYADILYVRTPLSLLSPAWQGSATSADGMNVYVLEETPILLLSDKGSLVRARLGEVAEKIKE